MKRILFDVPKWDAMLHRDHRQMPRPRASDSPLLQLEDELFERLYSGGADALAESDVNADLRPWAEAFHRTCDELPDFQRLAAECRGDPAATAVATESIMDELELPEPEEPPQAQPSSSHQQAPRPGPHASGAAPAGPQASAANAALRRQLLAACAAASKNVDELRELLAGMAEVAFDAGKSGETPPGQREASVPRSLAARIKSHPRLKRIALLAGRMKRIAAAKRRQRVRHGADEITDIEQGGELARALPSELGKLSHPRRRLDFLRALLERQVVQYQLSGAETLGRGPLIVLLDKSDSMDGDRDTWATALALALLQHAKTERRAFALIAFNHDVKDERVVELNEDLPEEALFTRCGGGTAIDTAIARGLDLIRDRPHPLKKSDLVLITDGESNTEAAPALRERARAMQVSIFGLAVGMDAALLAPWCDATEAARDLSTVDDGLATQLFAGT